MIPHASFPIMSPPLFTTTFYRSPIFSSLSIPLSRYPTTTHPLFLHYPLSRPLSLSLSFSIPLPLPLSIPYSLAHSLSTHYPPGLSKFLVFSLFSSHLNSLNLSLTHSIPISPFITLTPPSLPLNYSIILFFSLTTLSHILVELLFLPIFLSRLSLVSFVPHLHFISLYIPLSLSTLSLSLSLPIPSTLSLISSPSTSLSSPRNFHPSLPLSLSISPFHANQNLHYVTQVQAQPSF